MTIRPHKKASYGPITWAKHTRSSSSCFFFFFFFSRLASIISMCFQRQSDFRPVIVDPVNVGEPLYFCPDFHSCQSQFESEQIPSLRTTRGHFQLFGHIYVKSPYSVSGIIKQAREVNLLCESWFFLGGWDHESGLFEWKLMTAADYLMSVRIAEVHIAAFMTPRQQHSVEMGFVEHESIKPNSNGWWTGSLVEEWTGWMRSVSGLQSWCDFGDSKIMTYFFLYWREKRLFCWVHEHQTQKKNSQQLLIHLNCIFQPLFLCSVCYV